MNITRIVPHTRLTNTAIKITSSALSLALLAALPGCSKAQENTMANNVATVVQAQPTLVTGLPDFTQLVDKVSPAVVNIRTSERVVNRAQNGFGQHPICQVWPDLPICDGAEEAPRPSKPSSQERVTGEGSGFIYSADGYILTNHHVIDNASSITVTMSDKREFKASLIGSDPKTDVAVLKIEANNLPYLSAADSDKLKVGQWVIAAGSPFGLQNTITKGIISAINRDTGDYESFIQTDAAVNRGNSGGPLVNIYGEVVGINSQILSSSGAFAGIALAIPINDAMKVASQIRDKGHVTRGRIGVSISNISPEVAKELGLKSNEGTLISNVEPNSAAQKGGLQAGDLVLSVNGNAIKDSRDFARFVGNSVPGAALSIEIERQGKRQTLNLKVGSETDKMTQNKLSDTPKSNVVNKLGATVVALSETERSRLGMEYGVRITDTTGIAQSSGLREGDFILQVNKQTVTTPEQFEKLVNESGKRLLLLVRRNDAVQYLLVDLSN